MAAARRATKPIQSSSLLAAKLGALLKDLGVAGATPVAGAGGAAAKANNVGYVLHDPAIGVRALGPALLWVVKAKLESLVLFSDDHAGDLARRASLIKGINASVRQVVGGSSVEATPSPLSLPPALSPSVIAHAEQLIAAGVLPVDDFGRLVGEVEGLEIVRVETAEDGTTQVGVGVGQADRELHELVHSNLATSDAIIRAAKLVSDHRMPGAPPHPLNRLSRARWLRSAVVQNPSLVDATALNPIPPLRARNTVLGSEPAACEGQGVVVVCSAGVDPDLVPEALDYRARQNNDAELVLVLSKGDRLPTTDALIALCPNTRVVTFDTPWV